MRSALAMQKVAQQIEGEFLGISTLLTKRSEERRVGKECA